MSLICFEDEIIHVLDVQFPDIANIPECLVFKTVGKNF